MKPEELQQLKKGDEIFIRARYKKILGDGDVAFIHTYTDINDEETKTEDYTRPANVILPPSAPKYDPCRRFKKGDKVKLREKLQGRETSQFVTGLSLGKIYTVQADECNHTVYVMGDECLGRYAFVHLELVTPVEEIEPYSVGESTDYFSVEKDDSELCLYWKDKHPNPKAAAEAECARLNEEYRKEQA